MTLEKEESSWWVCSCGNMNSNSFDWCLECAKDFKENITSAGEVSPESNEVHDLGNNME